MRTANFERMSIYSSPRNKTPRRRVGLAVFTVTCLLLAACTSADEDGASGSSTTNTTTATDVEAGPTDTEAGAEQTNHSEALPTLVELFPADTSRVFAADIETLLASGSSVEVAALLAGDGADPSLNETFGTIGKLAESIDIPAAMTTALVGHTSEVADGPFLIAKVRSEVIDEVVVGSIPPTDGTYGPSSQTLYVDQSGSHLALLPDGVLVAGNQSVVESVLDVADGENSEKSPIALDVTLDGQSHISFVYALPALLDDSVPSDLGLQSAAAMTGALDLVDGDFVGSVAFHTSDASEFVETYNGLNRHATQGDDASEQPLTVSSSAIDGLEQIVVALPATPIDPTPEELVASRNVFKKLFVGMEAVTYAEGVADRTNRAWLDFLVKSEQGDDEPPSPGSVYIRWEFRDQAAIAAFEANELPAGFKLAPTRFLESDAPEGEYFLALNLYNAGSSLVNGGRAEWDVFVHGPEGADPNAGERPRFMVVEALAEEVTADAGNLLTPATPLTHQLADGLVTSNVQRFVDGEAVPVFESTFPAPDPAQAEVARFTREMAIGNDYIYWDHGVSDRVFYNATTFNHDAYFVDTTQLTFTDNSPWAKYLKPTVKDAVYYNNTLEYVASPMANLDSDHLDITPEWLAELVGFTSNGHQDGLMRKAVEQLFRGTSDALVEVRVDNETPSTYFNFEITDPEALSAMIELRAGHSLSPIQLFENGPEAHYMTLSIFNETNAVEGTRAEWSVYTDDGSGRIRTTVIDLMTAGVGFDSVDILSLPSEVSFELTDGLVDVQLSSSDVTFEASFETSEITDHELSLDWIEAGDIVCSRIGVCDKYYYDAETLDVPVHQPAEVSVGSISTPWGDFISETPSVVFYRDNAQEYVVARWFNLDVAVDALPFSGLERATHAITGEGGLKGRDTPLADSTYVYSGDAVVDGDMLSFAIDQRVANQLGVGNIFTTGSFDLTTGTGTVTVVDCIGPALLCSDIEPGSSTFYTAEGLDASDLDAITWQVDVVIDLGNSFGIADSTSTFTATRIN